MDGIQQTGRRRWEIFYGYGEEALDGETRGYNWRLTVEHKPTMNEIRELIINQINANTDEKILTGYEYDGKQVWLSTENQFNYKAAYDLAVQTEGKSLPFTIKVGATEQPEYLTFETADDFAKFYLGGLEYVQKCLAEGWAEKDGIDWTKYEI